MVQKYKGQSYAKLRAQCLSTKELFSDPLFPASDHSLNLPSSRTGHSRVVWKRPGELCENPRLFVEKASAHDVTQGRLGNCWFVAACSSLATVKALWSLVVPDYKDQEWDDEHSEEYGGIFHFRFWRFGEWLDVVVDDYLPTVDNQLIFCHSTTDNEFWSALLEKAFAKLCGSYGAMDGGNLCDALQDFTSGLSEIIELKPYKTDEEKKAQLRKQLLRKYDEHALMCCAISPPDASQFEARTSTGLVMGHAYGITSVKEINLGSAGLLSLFKSGDKLTMLRMRNPWGAKEWNGPFSDGVEASGNNNLENGKCSGALENNFPSKGFAYSVERCLAIHSRSPEWTRISKSEKEKLGLVFEDDGEFWIPFEDFISEFTDLSICHLINTSIFSFRKTWTENFLLGEWTRPNHSGGCLNHSTFLQNPQYYFDLPSAETELIIQLVQADTRGKVSTFTSSSTDYNSIGFHIMKVEDNRRHRSHKLGTKSLTSDYIKGRSVFFQGTLESGKGRYVLVPSTFEPNIETQFMLRVFSDESIKIRELRKDYPEPSWICAPFCSPPSVVTKIIVLGAMGLAAAENTYCVIKVEGESLSSEVIYDSQTPIWNLSGVFFRYDVCKPIFVELWENRKLLKDRFLGCAVLQGAADNELQSIKSPLVGRGRKASDRHPGELQISIATYDDLNAT